MQKHELEIYFGWKTFVLWDTELTSIILWFLTLVWKHLAMLWLLDFCVGAHVHVYSLTLVFEGRGGRGWGNRGSRCRDRTLANGLLHNAPPLHLIDLILYRDMEKMVGMRHKEKVEINQGKQGERRATGPKDFGGEYDGGEKRKTILEPFTRSI